MSEIADLTEMSRKAVPDPEPESTAPGWMIDPAKYNREAPEPAPLAEGEEIRPVGDFLTLGGAMEQMQRTHEETRPTSPDNPTEIRNGQGEVVIELGGRPTLARAIMHNISTELHGIQAQNMDLNRLQMTGRDLTNSDFSGSQLDHSAFLDSSMEYVSFNGANLSGATFRGCNLDNVDMRDADLSYAVITRCQTANLQLPTDPAKREGLRLEGNDARQLFQR